MAQNNMTIEQLGQQVKQKYTQYQGMGDAEVGQAVIKRYPQYKSRVQTAPEPSKGTRVGSRIVGGVKGLALDAPRQYAESGKKLSETFADTRVGQGLQRGIQNVFKSIVRDPQKQQQIAKTAGQIGEGLDRGTESKIFQPSNEREQQGYTVGQIGQFLMPGAATAKAARGLQGTRALQRFGRFAPAASRGIAEGVAGSVIGLGQTGDVKQAAGIGAADAAITTGIGIAAPGVGRASRAVRDFIPNPRKAVTETAQNVAQSKLGRGVSQTLSELRSRPGRAIERGTEFIETQAERQSKLQQATPQVRKAYESGLDDRIVDSLVEADKPTIKKINDMVTAVSDTKPKLGRRKNPPELFSGRATVEASNIVDKVRKKIGEQIGEASKNLPRNQYISSNITRGKAIDALKRIGVRNISPEGKLTWGATNITPRQRTKIQELFDLLPKRGQMLNPYEIHKMDQLFSAMQRESKRFDEILDILVPTADGGTQNLFQVLRNVFSETLDENTDGLIRELNKQYQPLANLRDNLSRTIFKQMQDDTGVDLAEIAGKRLRRIFSDAQSAPEYNAIMQNLLDTARRFGYEGADPLQLADFAEELRKIYPSTIPKTSFPGGINIGLNANSAIGLAKKVASVGAPNIQDQQRALIELIDFLSTSTPK